MHAPSHPTRRQQLGVLGRTAIVIDLEHRPAGSPGRARVSEMVAVAGPARLDSARGHGGNACYWRGPAPPRRAQMDRGVARDPARRCRALRKFRRAGCRGLLPGGTDRPRACLSRRCGGGPVAACGAGSCRAVSVRRSALAGHRGRRSPARGLLDAVRHRPGPDGREHAGARGRGPGVAPPDRRAGRARTRVRRAGPRRLRVPRGHHQRRLRADVAAPRRRDRRRRTRARLSHLDAGRRVRRPGRGARPPDVVRVRLEGPPPARPRRDGGHARSCSWCWPSCPRSETCPTSCFRCSCGRRCASGLAAPPRRSSSSARSPSGTRRKARDRSCGNRSPTACSPRSSSSRSRRSRR